MTAVTDAILKAVTSAAGVGSVAWDNTAESGTMRAEPRVDLRVTSTQILGIPSVSIDPVAGTTTVTTTSTVHLQIKVTAPQSYTGKLPVPSLASQIRRRLQMDLATRTAWQAVGLGFVDAGSAADLTGIAIDSREYFCSVVDVTLGFVAGIVEPGDGTADYFTRVQVSGTVVSVVPATDINETIGPAF